MVTTIPVLSLSGGGAVRQETDIAVKLETSNRILITKIPLTDDSFFIFPSLYRLIARSMSVAKSGRYLLYHQLPAIRTSPPHFK